MLERQAREEVIAAGKELVERGLVARTWGNVSCRIDAENFAITPSGIAYERLTPEIIVTVSINSLEYSGGVKPSSEKGIHAAAYRLAPSVNFVIHTHQTYASCLSLAGFDSLSPTKEEADILGGTISLADYGLPGTKKLKSNVEKALAAGSTAVLMKHHGALVTGPDRAAAFSRAVALEEICKRAAFKTSAPALKPTVRSRRVDGASFEITSSGGNIAFVDFGAKDISGVEALHAALYRAYPDFNNIMHLESQAVRAAIKSAAVLPAVLDDFAQMAGSDMKVCPALPAKTPEAAIAGVVRAVGGRNCVGVRGLGVLCCAADESDCAALLTLAEKNALAFIHAANKGRVPSLSWLDKKLMRFVYTAKYSKKK